MTFYGMGPASCFFFSIILSACLSVGMSAKIVNTIETALFQLGPTNKVHTRGSKVVQIIPFES